MAVVKIKVIVIVIAPDAVIELVKVIVTITEKATIIEKEIANVIVKVKIVVKERKSDSKSKSSNYSFRKRLQT